MSETKKQEKPEQIDSEYQCSNCGEYFVISDCDDQFYAPCPLCGEGEGTRTTA